MFPWQRKSAGQADAALAPVFSNQPQIATRRNSYTSVQSDSSPFPQRFEIDHFHGMENNNTHIKNKVYKGRGDF